MSGQPTVNGQEKTAGRLLDSSAAKSYDPELDIDWDEPLVEDAPFIQDEQVSLYGTDLWHRMTPEQRLTLNRHEAISMVSYGIYAETGLMHMLLRIVAEGDPTSKHAQYALTEMGDECRHSTMFGKMIKLSGIPAYRQPPLALRIVPVVVGLIPIGPLSYGATLLIEEVLDRGQRQNMSDPAIEPHMRMLNRIHVLEESRHITFAREELLRSAARLNRFQLAVQRVGLALLACGVSYMLVHPKVYKSVGIRPVDGIRARQRNPYYHRNAQYMAEKMVRFFDEAGMTKGRLTKAIWRRSKLVPADAWKKRIS